MGFFFWFLSICNFYCWQRSLFWKEIVHRWKLKKKISLKCTDHSSDKKETLDIGKTLDLTHLIVGCEKVCKQYGTEFMRKCTSKSFKQWTDFCGDSSGYKSNDITEEIPNPCYRVM